MSSEKLSPAKRGPKPKDLQRDTVGWRIRRAREKADLSIRQLGEKVGVSHASITRTETGVTKPDKTTLIRLAQELHDDFGLVWLRSYAKSAGELEEGEAPVYFGDEEHRIINLLAKQESRTFSEQARELALEALMNRGLITSRVDTNVVFLGDRVPKMVSMDLLGAIAAGHPIEAVPRNEKVDVPDTFVRPGRNQFVLRAQGDSMIDEGIHDGSLIVCDATNTAKNGDMVVALIDGEQATVKKFYKEKTRIRLQPANKLLKAIYVQPERLQIQGVVVGIIRHRP